MTATKDAPGFVKPYRVLKWTLDEAAKQAEHLQEVGCTVTVEPLGRSATLVEALEAALRRIDAVPADTQLPAMPALDRDFVAAVVAAHRSKGGL